MNIKRSAVLLTAFIIANSLNAQNLLFIPESISGNNINLTLKAGTHQFFNGQITNTLGANADVLGPTLILEQGELVRFFVKNELEDVTTIHWHGLHVAAKNDGGPHTTIEPDSTWSPSFTILDKAATYWYHPHLHQKTNEHVSKGIAGLIIVQDDEEALLDLPRTYGQDDFPLVLQTKDFDADNQIVVHSNSDDVSMVNATINPFLEAPAQLVRFRILNAAAQRVFNLGLSNNQSFFQIASDGGLLAAPFQTTRLLLAPGERAEILVDFSGMNGQNPQLLSYATELSNGIYGATFPGMGQGLSLDGYNPNPLNGNDFVFLAFNIISPTTSPITSVPSTLANVTPLLESSSNTTRNLTFAPVVMGPDHLNGNFLINNSSFDMSVVNYNIPLGNTEIWELFNQSGISHPFHIHDVQFNILTRNGVVPEEGEQGRKDVVLVKPQETVRFIAKFENHFDADVPYMYHCHMLSHEDDGMMGQFIVSNPLSTKQSTEESSMNIYPNPSSGKVFIKAKGAQSVAVFDNLGRLIYENTVLGNDVIQIDNLKAGIYYIQLRIEGKSLPRKVLVL